MTELLKKISLLGDVWVLWVLAAASVLSLGVMFERWRTFRRNRVDFAKFLDELTRKLEADDLSGARHAARNHTSIEARVALAGLTHHSGGLAAMEKNMSAKLRMERTALEQNLIVLGTLGNNAPFIGLFGTVLGIIKAFNDLAVTGTSGVSVVMAGISSALVATALGIFVAIPAVVANNYFYTKMKVISANCQVLMDILQAHIEDERPMSSLSKPVRATLS